MKKAVEKKTDKELMSNNQFVVSACVCNARQSGTVSTVGKVAV